MTYELKIGDEVTVRAKIHHVYADGDSMVLAANGGGGTSSWFDIHTRHTSPPATPDLAEAELSGRVTGPWAAALSDAIDVLATRLDKVEAELARPDADPQADWRGAPAPVSKDVANWAKRMLHQNTDLQTANNALLERVRRAEAKVGNAVLRLEGLRQTFAYGLQISDNVEKSIVEILSALRRKEPGDAPSA